MCLPFISRFFVLGFVLSVAVERYAVLPIIIIVPIIVIKRSSTSAFRALRGRRAGIVSMVSVLMFRCFRARLLPFRMGAERWSLFIMLLVILCKIPILIPLLELGSDNLELSF